MHDEELDKLEKNKELNKEDLKKQVVKILKQRAYMLAEKTNIDPDRLLAWVYVRVVLEATWCIEDGLNPSRAINLAEYLYSIVD